MEVLPHPQLRYCWCYSGCDLRFPWHLLWLCLVLPLEIRHQSHSKWRDPYQPNPSLVTWTSPCWDSLQRSLLPCLWLACWTRQKSGNHKMNCKKFSLRNITMNSSIPSKNRYLGNKSRVWAHSSSKFYRWDTDTYINTFNQECYCMRCLACNSMRGKYLMMIKLVTLISAFLYCFTFWKYRHENSSTLLIFFNF